MRVLHVGCGGAPLPDWIHATSEVRFDIDPAHKPDIVGDMQTLDGVDDDSFDAVYTSHSLEHLTIGGARKCLRSIRRVLKSGGQLAVIVPDLEGVKPTLDVLYEAPAGPITGLDMIYGHHAMVEGNRHMAHRCGFVKESLADEMESAGLEVLAVVADRSFNLVGIGRKQ